MSYAESTEFANKIKMKSFGNQTISDNSLFDTGKGIILYPVEGNLIIFDCNEYKEIKRIFISFSLIKVIKKIEPYDTYLICCENGHIFILNENFNIIFDYRPSEVNNVYSLDISEQMKFNKDKIYKYISISHHSITKEDDIYCITNDKDAISLIEMEINMNKENISNINFRKIFTKQSLNDFSVFNYNKDKNILKLISFQWEEANKYNVLRIYNISKENIINNTFNIEEKIIPEMKTEIKRYKKYIKNNTLKLVISCKKRYIHIFNTNTLSLEDSFKLEGVGELGEYYIDENLLSILMVNTTSQLININIKEKICPKEIPLNKDEKNLSDIILKDDFIRSMNWGLIKIKCNNEQNKIIIVNALGIKIYIKDNNQWKDDYYSKSILKMSGCGACSLKNNIYAYGDLSGNITVFDNNKEIYEQIKLDNEMVRSLCSDKNNNIIFIGTLSGQIFRYDYNNKKLSLLTTNSINKINENNDISNNEAITCLKYIHPNLYFSDTGGNIFIYNINESQIIYNFLPHEPQKDNNNPNFGSLSIKSEVWSFLAQEINSENLYIITCSEDQSVKIWKIKLNIEKNKILNNELIKEIKEHKFAVTCLDWTCINEKGNKKNILLTCSDDKTINIFDGSNEKFELILKTNFEQCIRGFFTLTYCSFNHINDENDFNEDNNLLCLGTQAGYLIIYDYIHKKIKFLEKIHYGGIEGVVFENNVISTCGNDNVFNIIEKSS